MTFCAFQLTDGDRRWARVPTAPGTDGAVFEFTRVIGRVRARRTGGQRASWKLLIVGVAAAVASSSGPLAVTEAGIRVTADPDTDEIEIVLSA